MNTQQASRKKIEFKNYHLIFIIIFLFAFWFRFFASQQLPLNSSEALILLNITGKASTDLDAISIIETLLIKMSFFIFGEGDQAARIWSILAGSLLVFVPLYLRRQVGLIAGILMSAFIAIEPLMIVNSIQIGSNIFSILFFMVFWGSSWKKDLQITILSIFACLLSGRGLVMISVLGLLILLYGARKEERGIKQIKELIQSISKQGDLSRSIIFIVVILFLMTVAVAGLDLSIIFSDFISNLDFATLRYEIGKSPLAFVISFFSYSPLIIALAISSLILTYKNRCDNLNFIYLWISISFLYVFLHPNHKYIDLIWVSFPLIFLSAIFISEIRNKIQKIDLLNVGIFLILNITILISFANLTSQGNSGSFQLDSAIFFVAMVAISMIILLLFSFRLSFHSAIGNLYISLLVVLVIIQFGFSFRASGLAGNQTAELLWSGKIFDVSSVGKQISEADEYREIKNHPLNIGLVGIIEPSIIWELRDYNVEILFKEPTQIKRYDVMLTDNESLTRTSKKYIGRAFYSYEFPKWSIEPLRSLRSTDFWSWILIRNTELQTTTDYLWISIN